MALFAAMDKNVSTLTQNVNVSLHAYARLKRMQRPSPVAPTRQDRGTHLDIVTASQPVGPLGPMAQGLRMTVKIRGVDLIVSQAPKMNMREVQSYCGSRVNNTTLGLRFGSIISGRNPTRQPTKNPSEFIAEQVPCRPDSYSQQEPNVRTLWPDLKMMVSLMKLTVPSDVPKQLSRFANPNHLKTGRSESNLRLYGECLPNSSKFSSLMETTKVHLSAQRSTPAHKFSTLRIQAAVCLQHRDQRIRQNYSRKLGLLSDPVTTRSDKHPCGKPMLTGPDKQATGNREPAYNIFSDEMCNARHS